MTLKRNTVILILIMASFSADARPNGATGEPLSVPDVTVRNQQDKPLHFYSDLVKGKVVAINFIFTSCSTICPPLGANFARLQDLLGDRCGTSVRLISVSVNPTVDTPQRLHAWAARFSDRPGWDLITGDKYQIDKLLKAINAFAPDITEHSPLILIGNEATGVWTRVNGMAPPDQIVGIIDQVAASKPNP